MEIYLDYNATTPLDPQVFEVMKPFLSTEFGNASSFHQKGQKARHAMEEARESIADFLDVEPIDILFTSGGTESDNLAIQGVMGMVGSKRPQVVMSAIEHQAVLHQRKFLEKQGFQVSVARVDSEGIVDLNDLKKLITDKTALVSLMHVNNEVGTIQPIVEAAQLAHDCGAYFHTDAVQSFGKIEIHPEEMGADLVSVSAHKICGPKGAGALYVRKGLKLEPLFHGGHQEKNIRPGTENVAAIAGFGQAVKLVKKNHADESKRVRRLRDKLQEGLWAHLAEIHMNGDLTQKIYNTLSVSFDGLDGEALLMNLDLKNICVSTGSACTAGSVEPSHVLLAMGLEETRARSTIRFSLGRFTTDAEIEKVTMELPIIVERLRKNWTGKSSKSL